jgi:lysyl-tRNA synthetase class 2
MGEPVNRRAQKRSDSPSPRFPDSKSHGLAVRSKTLHAIRSFFHERGFLEVETPVRVGAPALELHIDAEPSGDRWLRTSPELHMKQLLAWGHGGGTEPDPPGAAPGGTRPVASSEAAPLSKIFQMGPCFRCGERGDRHHPEYTMLEWYRAHADYTDILADTKSLIARVAQAVRGATDFTYQGRPIQLLPRWERITVAEVFLRFAGWDPTQHYDEERFTLDLVEKVEPRLPADVPVVLTDYPAEAAALARRKPDNPRVAERWELYIGGLELANAYSELTDAAEQRSRFEACARARKARGKEVYPMDEEFLAALASMPPSGGIALGVDRLVMLLADAPTLDHVMAFRE